MFINPIMLAGLGGAVIPLVLHLLAKARYRSIDWGAMMFLIGADARQNQSTKLKQWILLLIRMAIVALLAMALARPVVQSNWGGLAGESRLTLAIVLDCSASMAKEDAGRSRFDRAREMVLQIVGGLRSGDRAGIVLCGQTSSDRVIDVTSDLQSLITRVTNITPGRGMADLSQGMQSAIESLDAANTLHSRIFILTDRQGVNWKKADSVFRASWTNRLARAKSQPAVTVIPIGDQSLENIAIEDARVVSPPAIRGQLSELDVVVRNYGVIARPQVPVTLSQNSVELGTTRVNLPPGAQTRVKIPFKFSDPGTRIVTVAARTPSGQIDEFLERAIDITQPLRVLIVSGEEREDASRSKSIFLKAALTPFTSAKKQGADLAQVTVQSIENWASADLAKFQVIILADVPRLSGSQVRELEQFVYGGGGLFIAPGKLAQANFYNEDLFRDGAGVMPASLQNPVTSSGIGLLGLDLTSPVFAFLRDRSSPIPKVTIDRYFPATPTSGAKVLASYSTGQPFCISNQFGRGVVTLVTTSMDGDWSNLPLSNFYLPFIQSITRELGGAGLLNRNLEAGQPFEITTELPIDDKSASVFLPTGVQDFSPEILKLGDRGAIRFTNTEMSGRYQLRYKSKGKDFAQWFVVNGPAEEANPAPLTEDELKDLSRDLKLTWVEPAKMPEMASLLERGASRELWGALLAGVFGLAAVEMVLARRWSREVR